MIERSNESQHTCQLMLEGALTTNNAYQVKRALDGLVGNYSCIKLDLMEIEEFDSTGVQIILSWNRWLEGIGKKLVITEVREPVLSLFELYSVVEHVEWEGKKCQ